MCKWCEKNLIYLQLQKFVLEVRTLNTCTNIAVDTTNSHPSRPLVIDNPGVIFDETNKISSEAR